MFSRITSCFRLFFELIGNKNKRKLFFGSEFNRNIMYRKHGIIPSYKVNKIAVVVNTDGEEKVHIIEDRIK